jgi:hypothetical protein
MIFASRAIWNNRRIDLSTAPKKLSTGPRASYPQAVSNLVTNCYDVSIKFRGFMSVVNGKI